MRREPDNLDVIDDSGSYDVRKLREEGRIVYVERSQKKPDWLVVTATTILAGAVFAAWTANARLATSEAQISFLREDVGNLRSEVAELKRIIERYHDSNAH